jgi:hypothetical protein
MADDSMGTDEMVTDSNVGTDEMVTDSNVGTDEMVTDMANLGDDPTDVSDMGENSAPNIGGTPG